MTDNKKRSLEFDHTETSTPPPPAKRKRFSLISYFTGRSDGLETEIHIPDHTPHPTRIERFSSPPPPVETPLPAPREENVTMTQNYKPVGHVITGRTNQSNDKDRILTTTTTTTATDIESKPSNLHIKYPSLSYHPSNKQNNLVASKVLDALTSLDFRAFPVTSDSNNFLGIPLKKATTERIFGTNQSGSRILAPAMTARSRIPINVRSDHVVARRLDAKQNKLLSHVEKSVVDSRDNSSAIVSSSSSTSVMNHLDDDDEEKKKIAKASTPSSIPLLRYGDFHTHFFTFGDGNEELLVFHDLDQMILPQSIVESLTSTTKPLENQSLESLNESSDTQDQVSKKDRLHE